VTRNRNPKPEEAYDLLRGNELRIAMRPEWAAYLSSLPPYHDAIRLRAQAPLLAIIKWEIAKAASLGGIEHIIVDEAEDVTPLEWVLLAAINETDTWTLIGDLNQRRSNDTPGDWEPVLKVLGLKPDEVPVERLQRGYRSTSPILEYANRLLPRSERDVVSFEEDGPALSASLVPTRRLGDAIVEEADRLLAAYPPPAPCATAIFQCTRLWDAIIDSMISPLCQLGIAEQDEGTGLRSWERT